MRIEEEQSLSLVLRRSFLFQWDGVKYGWKRNCWFFDFGFIFSPPNNNNNNKKRHFSQTLRATSSLEREENLLPLPPHPLFTSDPIRSCTVFISEKFVILGRQRFLVSTTAGLKYVNMYLGQFQWPCLVGVFYFCWFVFLFSRPHHPNSQDFKFFNPTLGRKRREEKKTVCKSFRIFQRD